MGLVQGFAKQATEFRVPHHLRKSVESASLRVLFSFLYIKKILRSKTWIKAAKKVGEPSGCRDVYYDLPDPPVDSPTHQIIGSIFQQAACSAKRTSSFVCERSQDQALEH